MSEFQIVKFRAIDRPLSDNQLEFMERQSSRADFTKWEFKVEYHYSSFRGDVDAMLRNGYDIFLTYSNYGCREIRMRLPGGLPFAKSVWSKYISAEGLTWSADKSGKAGILTLAPYLEEAYDPVWEFEDYLDATAKLREMLIAGDLRALYVLWLCTAMSSSDEDDAVIEPPVPHGLANLPDEAADLLAFFEADPLLVDAAAIGIPMFNAQGSQGDSVKAWLTTITDSRPHEIIQRLLSEDPVAVKAELLSEIRESRQAPSWPVEPPTRTVAQLLQMCESLRQKEDEKEKKQAAAKAKREADKAEKQRQARMVEMQSAPESWLNKASMLVEERGTDNYREAASILADLRDAVGGEQGNKIAREHAAHLAQKYPTLNVLKSSLRKKELLD
ncbi:MAG: hypothetical protein NTW52_20145 [Planctomycetota bacterium]|nr:hypothetical protein [Planctomycetota bacterium]